MRIKPSIGNCTYFATSHCFKRGQFKMEMINHWTCNYPIFRKKNTKKSCTLLGIKSGFQSLALVFHQNHGADHRGFLVEPSTTYWTRAQSVPGVASLVACITWCWMFHVAFRLSKHEIPTKSTLSSCCLQTYQTLQFWCILLLHKPHTLW